MNSVDLAIFDQISSIVDRVVPSVSACHSILSVEKQCKGNEKAIRSLFSPIPDTLFPSDNELEIPVLRLDMQPNYCELPFERYGEKSRSYNMKGNGTLHFYTDDYKFNTLFEHPDKIIKMSPSCIVEPNYSLSDDMALAVGIHRVYKKRFIARLLQEQGIRVYVDLNVSSKWCVLNLLGVPRGYRSFCTRGYAARKNHLEMEYRIAQTVAEADSPTFIVYGGGETVRAWCREHCCIYVPSFVDIRRMRDSIKKQMENAAVLSDFFLQELRDMDRALTDGCVMDYSLNKIENTYGKR